VKDELRDALSERDEAAEAIRRDDMLSSRAAAAQLAPFESKVWKSKPHKSHKPRKSRAQKGTT
jgi:hypothetical protein